MDPEQAAGVTSAREQLTAVRAILPTSSDHFHLPPGKPYTNGTVRNIFHYQVYCDRKAGGHACAGCYVVRDEEEFKGIVTGEPTFQAVRG